jgi:hypothetical protein
MQQIHKTMNRLIQQRLVSRTAAPTRQQVGRNITMHATDQLHLTQRE